MTTKFFVETKIGKLTVIPSAPDEHGIAHVWVETGYGNTGEKQTVEANGIAYRVSYVFTKDRRVSSVWVRRAYGDWKQENKVSDSARKKIHEACEFAFDRFMAENGEKTFVEAEQESLRYQINRLDEKIAELEEQKKELVSKLGKISFCEFEDCDQQIYKDDLCKDHFEENLEQQENGCFDLKD